MIEEFRKFIIVINIEQNKTKALLVEKDKESLKLRAIGEADTTLDPPHLDVTLGVINVIKRLEAETGERLLGKEGHVDAKLLCSSSDSGGLYMMVAGLFSKISSESAQRAALGAGAQLMDVYSIDDLRPDYVITEKMRSTKPDLFLLAGGTDGGAFNQVLGMAKLIKNADIKPRFGDGYKLPIIYAGNVDVREEVAETLTKEQYATRAVDNVRPVIERENLGPAKEAIYDSYMQHVIAHSPGYDKLAKWIDRPIIPTQAAIGKMVYSYAMSRNVNLLAVNVGGATTDVYSVYNGIFNRSLNADVGLTYGILNVLKIVGVERIKRWITDDIDERAIRNIIANLMLPQHTGLKIEESLVREAVVREAVIIGVAEHKRLASRLKGVTIKRTIADTFYQSLEDTYLDMSKTHIVIGMGNAFSEPYGAATLTLLDSTEPIYFTEFYVDTMGIMPQTGALLEEEPAAALNILTGNSLRRLCTCIAPRGKPNPNENIVVKVLKQEGITQEAQVKHGEIRPIILPEGEVAKVEVTPGRGMDLGAGKGKPVQKSVAGGSLGLVVDGRGRPISLDKSALKTWRSSLASVRVD